MGETWAKLLLRKTRQKQLGFCHRNNRARRIIRGTERHQWPLDGWNDAMRRKIVWTVVNILLGVMHQLTFSLIDTLFNTLRREVGSDQYALHPGMIWGKFLRIEKRDEVRQDCILCGPMHQVGKQLPIKEQNYFQLVLHYFLMPVSLVVLRIEESGHESASHLRHSAHNSCVAACIDHFDVRCFVFDTSLYLFDDVVGEQTCLFLMGKNKAEWCRAWLIRRS